jgi:PAS domain S-box-containing protein
MIQDHPESSLRNPAGMTPVEMQRIIHELRVHEIELEAQNEELRRQHGELMDSEARNAQLKESLLIKSLAFDLAINAISIANTEGVLTQVNAAFLRIWGYASAEEVIGYPIPHFLQDSQDVVAIIAALNGVGCWEGSFAAKRKDGSSFIAHGLATAMRDELGRHIGYQSSVLDITERITMEAALEKSRHFLAETERIGKVGGWEFDIETRRQTWTEEVFRILEVPLDYQPTVDSGIDFFTAASKPVIARAVQCAIELGEPYDLELEVITAKGNLKSVHAIGRADLANRRIHGFFQDITERKRAEFALREWNQRLEIRVAERTKEFQQSEARFRQLAETTFEGIVISENGIVIDGNPQLARMHGYDLAEMVSRPIANFVAPDSRTMVAENLRIGNDLTYECLGLRKDGSIFPIEVHARMGMWNDRPMRITALRDLTESKRLAASLQTQQTALEHAQRLALVSEVCAGIVHQISQPLCAIWINLAVIQARLAPAAGTSDGTSEIVEEVMGSLAGIREVIQHTRALLQIKTSDHLPTDCHRLLAEVLPLLRQEAEHRGIRLAVELAPDLPTLLADGVQLHQVILILTRNAFDACMACPPDRQRVVISTRAVGNTAVELSVCDTGTGIAPGVIEQLFAPFFSTKAGMGIGLRLSRTIVEAHGGSIHASNNADGIGATFQITLPVRSPASPT